MTETRELPSPVPADRRARIRVDEWRKMTLTERQALVARFVGYLARTAQERGQRFRYWPTARVRWLAPEQLGSYVLIDVHPTMRDEATFVELIVETSFAPSDPRLVSDVLAD